jgi:hypothetical protein
MLKIHRGAGLGDLGFLRSLQAVEAMDRPAVPDRASNSVLATRGVAEPADAQLATVLGWTPPVFRTTTPLPGRSGDIVVSGYMRASRSVCTGDFSGSDPSRHTGDASCKMSCRHRQLWKHGKSVSASQQFLHAQDTHDGHFEHRALHDRTRRTARRRRPSIIASRVAQGQVSVKGRSTSVSPAYDHGVRPRDRRWPDRRISGVGRSTSWVIGVPWTAPPSCGT